LLSRNRVFFFFPTQARGQKKKGKKKPIFAFFPGVVRVGKEKKEKKKKKKKESGQKAKVARKDLLSVPRDQTGGKGGREERGG